MSARVARAVMALAICCMDARRAAWTAAMRAEFEVAAAEGHGMSFAAGCLVAAGRELVSREEGWFTLTSYALTLGVMMPMAAIQIGCALFGLPYLYPGPSGLPGALLEGRTHEGLLRGVYQGAVPSLALLLLALGLAHLRIAWMMLERDWAGVRRLGMAAMAVSATLMLFMGVLFLDATQVLLQAAVLAIELASVSVAARWQVQLPAARPAEHPG